VHRDDVFDGSRVDHLFAWSAAVFPFLWRGAVVGRLVANVSTGVFFLTTSFSQKGAHHGVRNPYRNPVFDCGIGSLWRDVTPRGVPTPRPVVGGEEANLLT
jgi:hypothetical protein